MLHSLPSSHCVPELILKNYLVAIKVDTGLDVTMKNGKVTLEKSKSFKLTSQRRGLERNLIKPLSQILLSGKLETAYIPVVFLGI